MAEIKQPVIVEALTVASGNVDASKSKGVLKVPGGTGAERPVTPEAMDIRKNVTAGRLEAYDPASAQWQDLVFAKDLDELRAKASVQAVSLVATTNVTSLSGLQTFDGVALSRGERVLLAGQTNAAQNGIYIAGTGAWTRAPDYNSSMNVFSGATIPVTRGLSNKGAVFFLETVAAPGSIEVGVTPLVYGQIMTKLINKIASSRAIAMALALS